ncbi:DUF1439 domain-containing protein [Marinomonas sp. 15G1-11]|uniref:DUF1439 domain-containing protein n=1 Tax=Marinomonas phaeophyticola TaxID=3004091 RepID=A0ABT4JTZ9_9GAMM|nr:DUF1439 domain-containing protein [Marinomonas sp. 15G1-11]MCZ2721502.1 DUF1439 domain-containing protein [Marinomonas sp. 15G1-11]
MKKIYCSLMIILSVLLSGCNSYRLSEAKLNEEIVQRIKDEPKQSIIVSMGEQTVTLDMVVIGAVVDLMAKEGGVAQIRLSTDMTGTLNMFGKDISVQTDLMPYIQAGVRIEEGKIYLVNPKVLEITVNGSSFNDQLLRSALGPLHDDFEVALSGYFSENPVYIMNHSALEESAALVVKKITINEDEIVMSMF